MIRVLFFALLTVGFPLFAAILFPLSWSRRVRALHLRGGAFCRHLYARKAYA